MRFVDGYGRAVRILAKGEQMGLFLGPTQVHQHLRQEPSGKVVIVQHHTRRHEAPAPGERGLVSIPIKKDGTKSKLILQPRSQEDLLGDPGVPIIVSTSGGKDSQVLLDHVMRTVPNARARVVMVNADLGEAEWDVAAHLKRQSEHYGVPVETVKPIRPLLEAIEKRGRWPDMSNRYCTSDSKVSPINQCVRRHAASRQVADIIVATGERREESSGRSKLDEWGVDHNLSSRTRAGYRWRPVLDLTEKQVFEQIEKSGLPPHEVYAKGMHRLSCAFCVFGSPNDLATAAKLRPELYQRYMDLEERMGHAWRVKRKPKSTWADPAVPEFDKVSLRDIVEAELAAKAAGGGTTAKTGGCPDCGATKMMARLDEAAQRARADKSLTKAEQVALFAALVGTSIHTSSFVRAR